MKLLSLYNSVSALTASLICIIIAVFIFVSSGINFKVVNIDSISITPSALPINLPGEGEMLHKINLNFDYRSYSQNHFRIKVDECLEVTKINGKIVDTNFDITNKNDLTKKCNYNIYKYLDISKYANIGANNIEFEIKDTVGNFGIDIVPSFYDSWFLVASIILLAGLALLIYTISNYLKFDLFITSLILCSVALRFVYWYYTDIFSRTNDVEEHIIYINKLSESFGLKSAKDCVQCYHPPLYYWLVALLTKIYNILQLNSLFSINLFYQLISIFISSVTLLVNVVIAKLYLTNLDQEPNDLQKLSIAKFSFKQLLQRVDSKKYVYLGVTLICFWPSEIFNSVRVGNDILLYCVFSFSFLFLSKWWFDVNNQSIESNLKNIYWATFFCILAILTKSNGLLIGIILLIYITIYIFKKFSKTLFTKYLPIYCIINISFLLLYVRGKLSGSSNALISNVELLPKNFDVKNTIDMYLYFDYQEYISIPMQNLFAKDGLQYFWNSLLKTSLFSHHTIFSVLGAASATIISFVFLVFVYETIFFSLFKSTSPNYTKINLPTLALVLMILALAVTRYFAPFIPTTGFRYIQPAIVYFVIILVTSIHNIKQPKFKIMYITMIVVFVLFSIIMEINPAINNYNSL
jgi:hypothetical protein